MALKKLEIFYGNAKSFDKALDDVKESFLHQDVLIGARAVDLSGGQEVWKALDQARQKKFAIKAIRELTDEGIVDEELLYIMHDIIRKAKSEFDDVRFSYITTVLIK